MEDNGGGGRRSLRYEFGRESNASTAGLTLGGILSIKETTPYQIQNRTLLDLIRNDQTCGNDSKKTWKMFREKLRLKLVTSVCTTAVPILASHVHITTDSNRMTTQNDTTESNSAPVSNTSSVPDTQNANRTNRSNSPPVTDTSNVADTQTANVRSEPPVEELEQPLTEENRRYGGDGGEPTTVKVSLMSLLEVDGSAYCDEDEEGKAEEEVAEEGGSGGGGGGGGYNNCCVCMVRHKGAAFIPCGHTFCRLCSRELFVKRANCPLCNNIILEILDIF